MLTKERSANIVKFHDQWRLGILCKSVAICHYSEYAASSNLSVYGTLLAIVLRDYNAAYPCQTQTVDFYLFNDADIKRALLTRSQC